MRPKLSSHQNASITLTNWHGSPSDLGFTPRDQLLVSTHAVIHTPLILQLHTSSSICASCGAFALLSCRSLCCCLPCAVERDYCCRDCRPRLDKSLRYLFALNDSKSSLPSESLIDSSSTSQARRSKLPMGVRSRAAWFLCWHGCALGRCWSFGQQGTISTLLLCLNPLFGTILPPRKVNDRYPPAPIVE